MIHICEVHPGVVWRMHCGAGAKGTGRETAGVQVRGDGGNLCRPGYDCHGGQERGGHGGG